MNIQAISRALSRLYSIEDCRKFRSCISKDDILSQGSPRLGFKWAIGALSVSNYPELGIFNSGYLYRNFRPYIIFLVNFRRRAFFFCRFSLSLFRFGER